MKASQFARDADGVPIVTREFLELKAEELLDFVDPQVLTHPMFTPLAAIAQRFAETFHTRFDFDQDLGVSESGRKILGKFAIRTRAIYIDRSLEVDSPRWRFTLAHEIGHLVLHRTMRLASSGVVTREGEISDTDDELDDLDSQPHRSRDWMEWQANKFASSLLMPRLTLRQATQEAMQQVGIDRLTHRIFVDWQKCNVTAYEEVLRTLTTRFLCSRQATDIRLKELDLVYDVRLREAMNISDLFTEEEGEEVD